MMFSEHVQQLRREIVDGLEQSESLLWPSRWLVRRRLLAAWNSLSRAEDSMQEQMLKALAPVITEIRADR